MSAEINLTILNKIVKSLNDQLAVANATKGTDSNEYLVEVAKFLGLATAVSLEASALTQDAIKTIQQNSAGPNPFAGTDLGSLEDLFGGTNPFAKKKN